MKILVLLQNAWSAEYAGKKWPRKSWLKALKRSRSGQRLNSMENSYSWDDGVWIYENATPAVGDSPDTVIPPDPGHIKKVIQRYKPDITVACGAHAAHGLLLVAPSPMLKILVPHPASRVLTNALYERVGADLCWLANGFEPVRYCDLVRYSQKMGSVEVDPAPWLISSSLSEEAKRAASV